LNDALFFEHIHWLNRDITIDVLRLYGSGKFNRCYRFLDFLNCDLIVYFFHFFCFQFPNHIWRLERRLLPGKGLLTVRISTMAIFSITKTGVFLKYFYFLASRYSDLVSLFIAINNFLPTPCMHLCQIISPHKPKCFALIAFFNLRITNFFNWTIFFSDITIF